MFTKCYSLSTRAIYMDADIYLLDDPLSAVDVHVGTHIFNMYVYNYWVKYINLTTLSNAINFLMQ